MPEPTDLALHLPRYRILAEHYDACLHQHGDCARGVDWPDERTAQVRYAVMADLMQGSHGSLIDFGCGAGHFLEFLIAQGIRLDYRGIDISPSFIELCRRKFKQTSFECMDVLSEGASLPEADYIVMNGIFTMKLALSDAAMTEFMHALLRVVFAAARKGIAFNLMSKHVDWERDDLFHVGYDDVTRFVTTELSRHYHIRADYGLYEYTVYVYRSPQTSRGPAWQTS